MTVDVVVDHPAWTDALPDLRRMTDRTYDALREQLPHVGEGCGACLCLSDDAEVRRLNGQYRQKDKPTNVLSFPSEDRTPAPPRPLRDAFLGDVIMALETMRHEADDAGIPLAHHFSHLLTHGLLHLLGYDHETDADAAVMEPLETRILARLGVPDPYADDA